MDNLEKILDSYLKEFGELPILPKAVDYNLILDLMEDAVISKQPVTNDDIVKRLNEIDDPVDLS